jgi:hypothetical protein
VIAACVFARPPDLRRVTALADEMLHRWRCSLYYAFSESLRYYLPCSCAGRHDVHLDADEG